MATSADPIGLLRRDLARYGSRPWLRELSVYALLVHRFGQWGDRHDSPVGALARRLYWPVFRLTEAVTGISLPKGVSLGGGCRVFHFGGIVVHDDAVIGDRLTLRHGVTIGERVQGGPVPTLGADVDVGAYAQILGGVTIGDGARIGALTLVLDDVPAGATAVGVPARVLAPR